LDLSALVPDRVELVHQRMCGIDLVVAIGTDQQEALQIRPGQYILEQVERRRVEPLQIIEEQRQWMFRPGEDTDEAPEDQLKTPVRGPGRKLRARRLVADVEFQFRDEIDDEPAVWAQCVLKSVAPAGQFGVALSQKWPDEALKRLSERRIRD